MRYLLAVKLIEKIKNSAFSSMWMKDMAQTYERLVDKEKLMPIDRNDFPSFSLLAKDKEAKRKASPKPSPGPSAARFSCRIVQRLRLQGI